LEAAAQHHGGGQAGNGADPARHAVHQLIDRREVDLRCTRDCDLLDQVQADAPPFRLVRVEEARIDGRLGVEGTGYPQMLDRRARRG